MLFVGAGMLAASAPARAADKIEITLDQARVLKLPDHTSTIVLGDPIIADVTLLKKSNSMILTGKSFGQTNLIALDKSGASLGESIVEVIAPKSDLIVQSGMARQSYACDPLCQPTVNLGDDTKYESDVSSQITARNTLAEPKTP
jgi:Flp pilus assembly secretin CpaC